MSVSEHVKQRAFTLPPSLPPRGLRRMAAAEYVGVSMTTFDQMINDGIMPKPKRYRGCVIWDRCELDEAFGNLAAEGAAKQVPSNPWDAMSNV
jgi:predicted DNA-binding transcriptional regulator AlpA